MYIFDRPTQEQHSSASDPIAAVGGRVLLDKRLSLLSLGILLCAAVVYLLGVYHFQDNRWDDAYITFRFAQHIADGLGAVWNVGGERVEGFTSMLHVMLLAAGIRAGVDPLTGSLIISVVSVFTTVGVIVVVLIRQFGGLHPAAAAAVGLYFVDRSTAIHSASGLETQMFAALLSLGYLSAFLFVSDDTWQAAAAVGLTTLLICVTRPEGVLYAAAQYCVLVIYCISSDSSSAHRLFQKLALASAIALFGGLAYAALKFNYFGYLLPNPFYVKSDSFGLSGIKEVVEYLRHVSARLGPLALLTLAALVLEIKGKSANALRARLGYVRRLIGGGRTKAKIAITLGPPLIALIYYTSIIHEVGGWFRFSYPTFFYLALAVAGAISFAAFQTKSNLNRSILTAIGILWFCTVVFSQRGVVLAAPVGLSPFNQYHYRIAQALKETGLGSNATVLCDAAGIIPYISGFNQIDRVGLVDNYLSGRRPLTPEQREEYIWKSPADVYIGYEPPASEGTKSPGEDPRMGSSYVVQSLMGRKLQLIESRIFVQDPDLLHARMRELRNNWELVGEINWPGWKSWRLKSFVYIRRTSPSRAGLRDKLSKIVDWPPGQIDFDSVDRTAVTQELEP